MTPVSTLGVALALRRHELGLDLTSSALAMGVSRSTYTAYEMDSRRLSIDTLPVLAKFLDLRVEEILDLYGATCVLQASRALLGGTDAPMARAEGFIERARANGGGRMDVVRRVYFDGAAGTTDDEVPRTSTLRDGGGVATDEPEGTTAMDESDFQRPGDYSRTGYGEAAISPVPPHRARGPLASESPGASSVSGLRRDPDGSGPTDDLPQPDSKNKNSKKSKGATKNKKSKKSKGATKVKKSKTTKKSKKNR